MVRRKDSLEPPLQVGSCGLIDNQMKRSTWKTITGLVAALLLVVALRCCVATTFYIPDAGMENSLLKGDHILVNKWSYGLRLPGMGLWGYHRWRSHPARKEDILLFNNPYQPSQPVIADREVFIGRCLGAPGDTLLIDSLFFVDSSSQLAPDQKYLYRYPCEREAQLQQLLVGLHIAPGVLQGQDSLHHLRSFSRYEYYLLEQSLPDSCWIAPASSTDSTQLLHPLVVPRHGKPVHVYPWNITLLRNTLLLHEHRQADIRHDTLYVEGQPVNDVVFCHDYYWIGANNSVNMQDSRLFGFVPHSHLIGRASRIWFSKDPDASFFDGYRWQRMGQKVK